MTLASCILFWSMLNGIDPVLTRAIIKVESSGNPYALGKNQDSGLMQVRESLVPESQSQLFQSCTNVKVGTRILAQVKSSYYKMGVDRAWVNCYNLGSRGCKKLKHPLKWKYYVKVTKEMK